MKYQFVAIVALLVLLSCCGVQSYIGYDYCGKPCNEPSGIVCAHHALRNCVTYFSSLCKMKEENCLNDQRFNKQPMINCSFGRRC